MPREVHRKLMRRKGRPNVSRLLTFSCNHRLPLLGSPAIRDAFVSMLLDKAPRHSVVLRAWVVMPEHIHLIARPLGDDRIVAFLWRVKRDFGKIVIARWKVLQAPVLERIKDREGYRFWLPGGGHDEVIRGSADDAIAYVHNNPVRRGLVERAELWRWSSLAWRESEASSTTAPGEEE